MTVELLVPTLGESVVEATIAKWMKSPGESINSDEPLVELETEKVTLEVPSPISGVLKEISAKEGESVEVGALLGIISESNNESPTKNTSLQKNKEEKAFLRAYLHFLYLLHPMSFLLSFLPLSILFCFQLQDAKSHSCRIILTLLWVCLKLSVFCLVLFHFHQSDLLYLS